MSEDDKKTKVIDYDSEAIHDFFAEMASYVKAGRTKEVKPYHRKTWEISGDKPFTITNTTPLAAGRNEEDYQEFIPVVRECIQIEEAENSKGETKHFLTKAGKVKPTTIADYIIDVEKLPRRLSERQIKRIVAKVLPKIQGLEEREKGFFKKCH